MKQITISMLLMASFVAACETPQQETLSADFVAQCENPHDQRDEWLAGMILKPNTEETLEELRAPYIERGVDPEQAGSFKAARSIITGEANPDGVEETANYKACFDRFAG